MANDRHKTKESGSFQIGLFLGGICGALIMFLMGTKEGNKITTDIQKQSDHWLSELEKKIQELEEKGIGLLEQGAEIKDGFLEAAQESKSDVVAQVVDRVDDTLSHIEKLQERGRQATAAIRKNLFKNIPKK